MSNADHDDLDVDMEGFNLRSESTDIPTNEMISVASTIANDDTKGTRMDVASEFQEQQGNIIESTVQRKPVSETTGTPIVPEMSSDWIDS